MIKANRKKCAEKFKPPAPSNHSKNSKLHYFETEHMFPQTAFSILVSDEKKLFPLSQRKII